MWQCLYLSTFEEVVPVLTLGSLSKRWIVPGWRLGWFVINDPNDIFRNPKIVERLKKYFDILRGPSTFIQKLMSKQSFYLMEPFSLVVKQLELLPDGTLLVGGQAIAVIYFRAGYAPTDYPSESHKDVTKKPAEETPEITPTVDEAVLSPVNQDTITPLPSELDTMEPKEMLLSDEEKERNSAEEKKLEESPIDEEAAHNSPVVPAISIAVRQFGHFLRELSHSTQSAAVILWF